MEKICKTIATKMVDNSIIKNTEMELIAYGMHLMLMSVIDISVVIIISIMFHRFVETTLFLLAFIPLRTYAGGYHAHSELGCFMIFIFTYLVFLTMIKCIPVNVYPIISVNVAIFGLVCILKFAPIVNNNKPLNTARVIKYKKISMILVSIQTFIISVFLLINHSSIYLLSFTLGELIVIISMLAAILVNKLWKRGDFNEKKHF